MASRRCHADNGINSCKNEEKEHESSTSESNPCTGDGFLLLLGVEDADTVETADRMVEKICKLRIFQDEQGKTNLSLADVGGELLVVSQFTLYADCKKGNRPSFVKAGKPEHANALYEHFVEESRKYVPKVEHGSFGADMQVELGNEGPFTLVLTNEELGF